MSKWNRFFYHFQKDVALWLYFMSFLTLFRAFFILYFRGSMDRSATWMDVLWSFLFGMRFDAKVVTILLLPTLLLSIAASFANRGHLAERFRRLYGAACTVVIAIMCVVTIGYFREYHDQFNHFIVNLYYDDTKAILGTIWTAYHPLTYLAAAGIVSMLMLTLLKRVFARGFVTRERAGTWDPSPFLRAGITFAFLALLVIGVRGSWGRQPLQHFDAGVTRNDFLNKAILNPPFALYSALMEYEKYMGPTGVEAFLPDRNVRRAAQEVFSTAETHDNLDAYLRKTAMGPRNAPPRHIILIFMESYDSWPLLDKYRSLGITDNLKHFMRHGLSVTSFLPASDATMQSLAAIVTSFPYTGSDISFQTNSLATYPTSLPAIMRRLGYRTRLFYGGFLSWHRSGDFARAQGFDEIYGAPDISDWIHANDWGLQDEQIFDFAQKKIDGNTPSFDIIMNMSYHPPYDVDVRAKGFPLKAIPGDIAPMVEFDKKSTLNIMGHLWYADKCIGDFVRSAEKKLPGSVFAFTGDHYSRRFFNSHPSLYERSAVPFVLYGKDVLKGVALPKGVAGSHIDIGPTLIELAAPKGFVYYSLGRNLLAPRKDPLGIGNWMVAGPDFVASLATGEVAPLPGCGPPKAAPDLNKARAVFNDYYGIGWWRVKRGQKL